MGLLDRINDQISLRRKESSMEIGNYLDERLIVFLEKGSRDEIIAQLVEKLDENQFLLDKKAFYQAVLERERIVSTGIGVGVAIPHAKLAQCSRFFIIVGLLKDQGIDWDAIDGSLVRLIFVIGGPDDKQTEYLKILSSLTQAVKNQEFRRRLLKCVHVSEVLDLFIGCEYGS